MRMIFDLVCFLYYSQHFECGFSKKEEGEVEITLQRGVAKERFTELLGVIIMKNGTFFGILHHALKVVYTFHCHPEGSEVRTTRDLIARSIKISPSSR